MSRVTLSHLRVGGFFYEVPTNVPHSGQRSGLARRSYPQQTQCPLILLTRDARRHQNKPITDVSISLARLIDSRYSDNSTNFNVVPVIGGAFGAKTICPPCGVMN
jgi:hypothetical protein